MKSKWLRISISVVSWICTITIMYIIFGFSSNTGEESAQISQGLLAVIIERIGNVFSENFLRKAAHFSEYMAFGFFLASSIYFTFNKKSFYIPLIPCFIYAVSDEIHQYFVPDRACRVFDIFIDTCGSATGILVFLLIALIVRKILNKNQKHNQ